MVLTTLKNQMMVQVFHIFEELFLPQSRVVVIHPEEITGGSSFPPI